MTTELVPSQVIERLSGAGLPVSLIAEATSLPAAEVRVILRKRAQLTPEDEELSRQWAAIERDTIEFIRRTFHRGTQSDKMQLAKIVAGRMLSKRAGGDEDAREEMMVTWQEIREEQRAVKQLPDNVRALPHQLDYDEDDDD